MLQHREQQESSGFFAERRRRQSLDWMRELVASGLEDSFRQDARVAEQLPSVSEAVKEGTLSPFHAARKLLGIFRHVT